jgi:hypothetical protein
MIAFFLFVFVELGVTFFQWLSKVIAVVASFSHHHPPADFPESKPAIEDLKFCLERTNQKQQLLTCQVSGTHTRTRYVCTTHMLHMQTQPHLDRKHT